MRVLINGVPGWLGNRFLEILTHGYEGKGAPTDWKVRCLIMQGADERSLTDLGSLAQVEKVYGDVRHPETLNQALRDVDVVFHLVGIIHPRSVREFEEINVNGTRNMLQAATEAGVRRFVHVSSNSVGGTNLSRDQLLKETDIPRPYMNYGRSKYAAEKLVQEWAHSRRREFSILRPCWYYGPNQPDRQTTFFRMIKKGNPILFGDGTNLRSMTYLDNLVQAMMLAATKPEAVGQTYWIADERPYTTKEIYETIAELLNVKSFKPRYLPGIVSEMCLAADVVLQALGAYIKEIHVAGEMNKDIACSNEKAIRELGYKPSVGLREGMRRSMDWCLKHGQVI